TVFILRNSCCCKDGAVVIPDVALDPKNRYQLAVIWRLFVFDQVIDLTRGLKSSMVCNSYSTGFKFKFSLRKCLRRRGRIKRGDVHVRRREISKWHQIDDNADCRVDGRLEWIV